MAPGPEAIDRLLAGHPGWIAGNVLDLRPAGDFEAGHLPGAVSIPLPEMGNIGPQDLETRLPSIFLPARHEPLLVVAAGAAEAEFVAAHLESRGRCGVSGLGWPVVEGTAPEAGRLEVGSTRAHLWRPGDWLEAHEQLLPPPSVGPVLDIACGSGRASVWLAERGYAVTAVDWQSEALDLGQRLAQDRKTRVRFQERDLRTPGSLPEGPWAVILNFRFLQRDLFDVWPRLVMPGGVVLLRTFREAPGYTGHPRPRYRLARGELLRRFPAGSWEILAHSEDHDPDGRPAAGIVARRRT